MSKKVEKTSEISDGWAVIIFVGLALFCGFLGYLLCSSIHSDAISEYADRHQPPMPTATPNPDPTVRDNVEFKDQVKIHHLTGGEINLYDFENHEKDCMGPGYGGSIEISPNSCGETDDNIHGPYIQLTDDDGNETIITATKVIRHKAKKGH